MGARKDGWMRVGVIGAAGRMGQVVCRGVMDADDLDLVAVVDPPFAGRRLADVSGLDSPLEIAAEPKALLDAGAEVAVDFTVPDAVARNVTWCLEHGIHVVVGTTGWSEADLRSFQELAESSAANALVAPNFALGAVLMMHFAQLAARHLPDVEILELHHPGKLDAPSGTALRTADLVAASRQEAARDTVPSPNPTAALSGARGHDRKGVAVHAIRLPGLVAHQEVIFGGLGQTLTIRHDTVDRTAFLPGILLAVRQVPQRRGVTVGLEHLLDLPRSGREEK